MKIVEILYWWLMINDQWWLIDWYCSGWETYQGSYSVYPHHRQSAGGDSERWPAVHRGTARQDGGGQDPQHQPGRRQGGLHQRVRGHDRAVEDVAVHQSARSAAMLRFSETAPPAHTVSSQVSSIHHQVRIMRRNIICWHKYFLDLESSWMRGQQPW